MHLHFLPSSQRTPFFPFWVLPCPYASVMLRILIMESLKYNSFLIDSPHSAWGEPDFLSVLPLKGKVAASWMESKETMSTSLKESMEKMATSWMESKETMATLLRASKGKMAASWMESKETMFPSRPIDFGDPPTNGHAAALHRRQFLPWRRQSRRSLLSSPSLSALEGEKTIKSSSIEESK